MRIHFSRIWLFATPQTVAHQAPLSMGFSRQVYWSGLPFPTPEDLPNPGIEPGSLALQADSLLSELQGSPCYSVAMTIRLILCVVCFEKTISSVQFSCSVVSNSLWTHGLQQARLLCPSPTPGACSKSHPLSWWCHPTISSSVIPFSSHLQSFPASGSFHMNQFLASSGQRIGVSASTSVLPMNTQDWFPLGWTGWITLQFKGLSTVFSNTTVQKHQFFGAQLSL